MAQPYPSVLGGRYSALEGGWRSNGNNGLRLPSPTAYADLAAWYDISDYSSLVVDGSNRVSLIADKSGNSATNCYCSNVVASQSMTAANKSVTGNQVFTLDIAKESYRPSADRTIVSKLSGNDGFAILVLTTGVVRLRVGNGSSVTNVDSTAALTNTNFLRTTVAITWTDGVGASFTQDGVALGTSVAAAVTLTNAATSITIGQMLGRIYRVQVGSVYDCNPALSGKLTTNGATFSSGGDTWTLNSSGDLGARISGERDLVQFTASKQPIYTAASGGVGAYLTFDGSDDYMKAAAFALSQPETVYFVGQQVSWTSLDQLYDGNASGSQMALYQVDSSPTMRIFAGSGQAPNANFVLGTTAVSCAVFNAASSLNRVNRGTAATGDASTQNGNGFTLAARFDGASCGNIRFNEAIIRSAADATATQDRFALYAGRKWGISL